MSRVRLTRVASIVERLDTVAEEIQPVNPVIALAIDRISDRLEGQETLNGSRRNVMSRSTRNAVKLDPRYYIRDDERNITYDRETMVEHQSGWHCTRYWIDGLGDDGHYYSTIVREYEGMDSPVFESGPPQRINESDFEGDKRELEKIRQQFLKERGIKMLKNAQKYTEKLDKIADDVQAFSPELALQIDMVSDVIEGKREASTLKFDADEARYMANRFDYRVRSREADEPYMDKFNESNFEQVMRAKKNPTPVNQPANYPYMKVTPTTPAAEPAVEEPTE